jgi:pimeloyl-ACP methyl ester carboxylesterase
MSDEDVERLLERMTRARRRAKPRLGEAFYDADDRRIETEHGAVQAWRLGAGPAVLMVHGWEDDHALWSPLADEFATIGRAVVAFDLPGHGFSEAEEASWHTASVAIARVVQELGPIDAIVAHSFGCVATAVALSTGLDVARVVLIASPTPSMQGRGHRYADGVEFTQEMFERAAKLYEERTERPYGGFDLEAAARAMKAEAMIVHSLDDEQCPPEGSQALAEAWPGAELVMTDGLGHRLIAQDDAVMARIVDFVEGR